MKNKIFKKILFIFTAIIIGTLSISNVYAQSNMKVTTKSYINTGINGRIEAKFNTNKGYAYCVTPNKTGPNEGATLKYVSRKSKGGLVYLLDKATNTDSNYLSTQIAVWKYNNNYVPDVYKKNKNKSVVKKAYALAAEAEKHKDYTTTPTLSVNPTSSKLTETSDRKYYKTKALTATAKNNTTNITLTLKNAPEGAKIIGSNGNGKTTIKSGEKFYVRIPYEKVKSSKSFKVVVKTSGKVSYVERYSPSNSKLQDLSALVKENKKLTKNITLTVKPNKRVCEIVNGKYYGKKGNIVDKTTYSIECEKHTCEKVGDKYFGKKGNIVDKTTYSIECEKHTCEKVGDKYFGKNGNIVDKTTYSIECEKHTCELIGNTYFGKDGNIVDKNTYTKECEKHSCEIIDGEYFGKDGNIVDQKTYSKECEKHTCEIIDGTYYGINGYETDKKTYTKECEKHTCEIVDDMYFGKDGTETDKDTYTRECERHVCEKVGDIIFGKDGTEVDEETYTKECENHTCEIIDDAYFGKDGSEVDFETYKKDCMHVCEIYNNHYYGEDGEITTEEDYKEQCDQVVEVPDTANASPFNLLYIILGSALIGGTVTIVGNTKYSNK